MMRSSSMDDLLLPTANRALKLVTALVSCVWVATNQPRTTAPTNPAPLPNGHLCPLLAPCAGTMGCDHRPTPSPLSPYYDYALSHHSSQTDQPARTLSAHTATCRASTATRPPQGNSGASLRLVLCLQSPGCQAVAGVAILHQSR